MNSDDIRGNIIKDDSGFSLVELIICVAILAVATIPLMSAFSTSGNIIGKAQSYQNATSVAEGVMEEIKGSTIEQIRNNTDYVSVVENPAVYTYDTFSALDASTKISYGSGKAGAKKGAIIQQNDTPFYIFFKPNAKSNADALSSGGEKFDVVATIDATKNYAGAVGDTAADANSIELPVIERIDKGKHAVISKEINRLDVSAVETWKDNYRDINHLKLSDAVTLTSLTKEVIINIDGKDSESDPANNQAEVNCYVRYFDTSKVSFASDPCHISEKVYSGTFLGSSDTRVYVFYRTAVQAIHSNHNRKGVAACPAEESIIKIENVVIKNTSDTTREKARQVYFMMQEDDVYPTSDHPASPTATNPYYVLNAGNTKMTITAEDDSGAASPSKADENSDLSADGVLESSDGSLMVITNIPNTAGATGKSKFYYNKKDDYIYEIEVYVYDKNGEEKVHLTSTKDSERTPTPTPAPP